MEDLTRTAVPDRCPYSAVGRFEDCAAYGPQPYIPVDSEHQPMRPVATCHHLTTGQLSAGAYYPRCELGGAAERERWVRKVGAERLGRLRALSIEYRDWVTPLMVLVWQRKTEWLAAVRAGADGSVQLHRTREAAARLVAEAATWIDGHGESLTAVGVSPPEFSAFVRAATQRWAEAPEAGLPYRVPDDLLARFPSPIAAFVRAGRTEPAAT